MPVAALRPFRHRRFALVWTGGMVSTIGSWMQTVAVGALVTDLTRNPIWTAAAFVAGFLPSGVLSPIGGALADRVDRRRFVMASNAVEAAIAATLAALVGAGQTNPVLVTALVFLAGCVASVRLPFQHAMLPDLVPTDDLMAAVSLGSAQWNLGRVLGPAVAGVVIVAGSFATAFALNAASFLAVIAAFAVVRVPRPVPSEDDPGLLAELRAGAAVVRREPGCRAAIVLIAAAAGLAAPFIALIPAMASELAEAGSKALAGATGALTTAQGVGAVLGTLAFPSLVERFGRRRMLVAMLVATSAALVPYALAPTVAVGVVGIALVGACYICVLSGLSGVMQLRAPARFRGRLMSLFFATVAIVFPLGAMAQGVLAGRVGLRATTLGGGAALLLVVAAVAVLRPRLLSALDDPPLVPLALPGTPRLVPRPVDGDARPPAVGE
ncbi:MAG TPA: MFS transporter [Acidimicrobiales bacterium]|nr:MFS transporter [Acidimicrobiales bacterium]